MTTERISNFTGKPMPAGFHWGAECRETCATHRDTHLHSPCAVCGAPVCCRVCCQEATAEASAGQTPVNEQGEVIQ